MSVSYQGVIFCGFEITKEEFDLCALASEYDSYFFSTNEWYQDYAKFFFGKILYQVDIEKDVQKLPNIDITYAKANMIRSVYKEITNKEAPPCQTYLLFQTR